MKTKKFEDYLEMAVNLNDRTQGIMAVDDFEDGGLSSSSAKQYDNQEDAWRAVAKRHGMTVNELAAEAVRMLKAGGNVFPGIEGLAVLSGNEELFGYTDYCNVGELDQLICSMMYGGKRAQQWLKYARNVTKEAVLDEIVNGRGSGAFDHLDAQDVRVTNGTATVTFSNRRGADGFVRGLELMDKWLDFDVDLEREGGIFRATITTKSK